ncbi:hypothetical protein V8E55_010677 [Tylopilus felleus]
MTITEFTIIPFKSPPDFSEPALHAHFHRLSTWQWECSGFPLLFFKNVDDPLEVHLATGWASVEAHEAWIRGERNQELLRIFAPYVDMQTLRMVHLGVNFEAIHRDVDATGGAMVVERYDGTRWEQLASSESEIFNQSVCSLVGRNLAQDSGDVYVFRFVGVAEGGEVEVSSVVDPVERWVLKRINHEWGGINHYERSGNYFLSEIPCDVLS